jgi:ribonuclease HI
VYGRLPEKLLIMNPETRSIEYASVNKVVKCTNQRSELLAAIHGIEKIIKSYKKYRISKPVLIVSDSEYVIRWITHKMWESKREDTNLKTVNANRDLVVILYRSLSSLSKILPTSESYDTMEARLLGPDALEKWRAFFAAQHSKSQKLEYPTDNPSWMGLTVLHQNSHLTGRNVPKENTIEWERWKGNENADTYANMGLKLESDVSIMRKKL